MKHFIPAWYSDSSWWKDKAVPFYNKKLMTEFDDMISLMNMHVENNIEITFIVLNYIPDLRTFLHRHNLFEVSYTSLFDEIQGFHHSTPKAIDYRDLDWPEKTEFVFTPYLIKCITSTLSYSNIYFNQDGYIVWIEDFENDTKKRRYLFDDRGWLSAMRTFDDKGNELEQHYMTIDGDCILIENIRDGSISVNDKYKHRFNKEKYDNMSEFVEEQLSKYVRYQFNNGDIVIAASDIRHNKIISNQVRNENLCFTIFTGRNKNLSEKELEFIRKGKYWLVDSQVNEYALMNYRNHHALNNQMMMITPYDTQVLPNRSSQTYETYIGLWIDGLTDTDIHQVLQIMIQYLKNNEGYRLILLTREDLMNVSIWIKEEIIAINSKFNDFDSESDGVQLFIEEDHVDIELIKIKHVPYEIDLIETISILRVMIDLNIEPDLYLQICSISAGIPQINISKTDYVKNRVNGYIITSKEEILSALDYFLLHLKNWNYSFAYSIKLVDEYSSFNIVQKLNRLIEGDVLNDK